MRHCPRGKRYPTMACSGLAGLLRHRGPGGARNGRRKSPIDGIIVESRPDSSEGRKKKSLESLWKRRSRPTTPLSL